MTFGAWTDEDTYDMHEEPDGEDNDTSDWLVCDVCSRRTPALVGGMCGSCNGKLAVLSFERVHDVNGARCARWHPGYPTGDETWSGADWSNALAGEVGEACNVIKKLRRIDIGQPGMLDASEGDLREMLADELADVFLYLDLLAGYYGIDLPAAICRKFNIVSERQNFPERLP